MEHQKHANEQLSVRTNDTQSSRPAGRDALTLLDILSVSTISDNVFSHLTGTLCLAIRGENQWNIYAPPVTPAISVPSFYTDDSFNSPTFPASPSLHDSPTSQDFHISPISLDSPTSYTSSTSPNFPTHPDYATSPVRITHPGTVCRFQPLAESHPLESDVHTFLYGGPFDPLENGFTAVGADISAELDTLEVFPRDGIPALTSLRLAGRAINANFPNLIMNDPEATVPEALLGRRADLIHFNHFVVPRPIIDATSGTSRVPHRAALLRCRHPYLVYLTPTWQRFEEDAIQAWLEAAPHPVGCFVIGALMFRFIHISDLGGLDTLRGSIQGLILEDSRTLQMFQTLVRQDFILPSTVRGSIATGHVTIFARQVGVHIDTEKNGTQHWVHILVARACGSDDQGQMIPTQNQILSLSYEVIHAPQQLLLSPLEIEKLTADFAREVRHDITFIPDPVYVNKPPESVQRCKRSQELWKKYLRLGEWETNITTRATRLQYISHRPSGDGHGDLRFYIR